MILLAAASFISASPAAQAHPGTGIVVDREGRVYFTDLRRVWRWEPVGRLTAVVTGKHSHALRLDPEGRLEGEHLFYDPAAMRWWTSSWRLEDDGSVRETARAEEGFPFLFTPAVASDGTRYYARVDNNRRDVSEIYRRIPGGGIELLAGGAYGYADGVGRQARFGPIGALAVGPKGDLYLTDEVSVRKVAPSGRVETITRGAPLKPSLFARFSEGRFGKMMGLAVDARGNVFAANFGAGCVVRVTPGGRVTRVLRSEDGWSPSGVTLRGGDLYVLEWKGGGSVRVRRVSSAGTVSTLAVVRDGRPAKPSQD